MRYEVWEKTVPEAIKGDQLWSLRIYRTALYAGETARRDAHWLVAKPACAELAQQLARATESISANIAEGYSRAVRKDRARFFEYALGSAREARDWYFKARPYLGPQATAARLTLLATIIKVLLVLVAKTRPMAVLAEA
jgi:four helix bundle protein